MAHNHKTYVLHHYSAERVLQDKLRAVASGGAGGALAPPPPQFLAKQLTLSQPGVQILPTTVLRAHPPDVQTLRRP